MPLDNPSNQGEQVFAFYENRNSYHFQRLWKSSLTDSKNGYKDVSQVFHKMFHVKHFWKRFLKTHENCCQYFTIIFLVSICYIHKMVVCFDQTDLLETASYQRFSAICLKKNDLSTTVNNLTIHNTTHYKHIDIAIFHYTQQYTYIYISTSTYHKSISCNRFQSITL